MDWKNLPGSGGGLQDRRGAGGLPGGGLPGGGLPGGGLAVGGIGGLVLVLIALFFGIDPGVILGEQSPPPTQTQTPADTNNEGNEFLDKILGSTNAVWSGVFQQSGRTYTKPKLIRYSGGTRSGCGQASSAVGPFYCPLDNGIYIDTDFFRTMQSRLGGGGDFAYSYVVAHEVGHHVQNELGIADQVERKQRAARSEAEQNSYGVRLELQADCFAGVWGHSIRQDANLNDADIQEALRTAQAIGDDNLQRQSRGYVVPDSFTHGSSEQRARWFKTGYTTGDPNRCDTFNVQYNQL